ncbi:MAG: hypothetical protein KAW12_08510 [Candidatus Aminicenantes bacterium]|nr:hypothetical protein [Candidatus Aminicenantes bacterium]
MSQKQDKIQDLLFRSFDDSLNAEEQKELETALENSQTLREEKRQLEMQRTAVAAAGAGLSFKPFFAERVMRRVTTENKKESYSDIFFETLFSLFKRVALAGAAACLIIISYNLVKGENLKTGDALYVPQATYEAMLQMSLF